LLAFFTVVDDTVFAVAECVGGEVTGGLDETGLQISLLPNLRVGLFVERVLRVLGFRGVVAPASVSDVLRCLAELLERLIENAVGVFGDVEL
jgi:hypothetical protein